MASFKYLWTNRAKFKFGSMSFYRAWGKRLFSLSLILERNAVRQRLIKAGATIHQTAEIGHIKIDGHRANLTIGRFTFLGRVYMALHEDVIIGDYVCINDGVEILSASHDVLDREWKLTASKVYIEDYAWIGTGAMLLPGVRIGRGAVVGARAVVSKSVLPGEIVVGNPAKPISKRRSQELTYNPCEFLAENRAWLKG